MPMTSSQQRPARRNVNVIPGLTRRTVAREVLAGVTLLAIAVPLNIGYAQIAGLPPTAGLYALVLPAVIYAFAVSSRQLVASPDAAAAALVASSVGGLAIGGDDYLFMAMAQAVISGVLFAAAAVFKLGFLANFLSKPILIGFVGGLALDIMVSQVAKMLGVAIDSGGEFADKVVALIGGLGDTNVWSVVISVLAVVVLLLGRRIARAVPWALIVLVVATVAVVLADLQSVGVSVLGPVEAGPPRLSWPALDVSQWLALVPSAIALTLVTMAEGLLVSRSYAEKHGYATSPNRDLLAFGAANIASGVSGSFAVGSSTSRTAAMDQAGARTQLPSLIAAAGTLLLLVFGTALLTDIPSPAIGAVVAVAILPLLGVTELAELWRKDRAEFAVAIGCFGVTVFVGAIPGILVAFVLALVNLARRAAAPPIDVLVGDPRHGGSLLAAGPMGAVTADGVVVMRVAAPLFFANSAAVGDAIKSAVSAVQRVPVRHLVLDLEAVTDVDVTAAEGLQVSKGWLSEQRISLSYSRARPGLIDRMRHLGVLEGEHVYPTNRDALNAVLRDDAQDGV